MGGIQNFSRIVSQTREDFRQTDLFTQWVYIVHCHSPGIKTFHQKNFSRGKGTIHIAREIFNFCDNHYNSAEITVFLAKSNFNSSAIFGSLMTNNGVLERWHQGEFVFGHVAGDRNTYKNKLLVQGKYIDSRINDIEQGKLENIWDDGRDRRDQKRVPCLLSLYPSGNFLITCRYLNEGLNSDLLLLW